LWAFNPSTPSKQHAVTMSLESFSRPFKPITSSQYRFYIIQKKQQWVLFPYKQLLLNVLYIYRFPYEKTNKSLRTKTCRLCFGSFFSITGVGGFVGTCWKAETASFKLGTTPCATASFGSALDRMGFGMFNEQLSKRVPKKKVTGYVKGYNMMSF